MNRFLVHKVVNKDHVELGEDFIALTVLCYLKENKKEFLMNSHKQAQNLSNVIVVMICQIVMITCIFADIVRTEAYTLSFMPDFIVFYVKFPCTIALHLYLFPEVNKGMTIMKFANN